MTNDSCKETSFAMHPLEEDVTYATLISERYFDQLKHIYWKYKKEPKLSADLNLYKF